MTAKLCVRGSFRHWFRDDGVVGLVRPTCVRCGAENPKATAADVRAYREHHGLTDFTDPAAVADHEERAT